MLEFIPPKAGINHTHLCGNHKGPLSNLHQEVHCKKTEILIIDTDLLLASLIWE